MTPVMSDKSRVSDFLSDIATGMIIGMVSLTIAISLAALIFSGSLTPFLGYGISIALFSTAVLSGVVALSSSLPGAIANPQGVSAALTALIAASVAAGLPTTLPQSQVLSAIALAIGLSTLLTGVFLVILGGLRLGDLIRYIPYPVIGGFVAGIAWLLMQRAFVVLAGTPLQWRTITTLIHPSLLVHWLPGLIFGLGLLAAARHAKPVLAISALLIGGVAAFYLILALGGASVAQAMSDGWLLGPFPHTVLWEGINIAALGQISLRTVLPGGGTLLTLGMVTAVSLLLAGSALELVAQQDLDLNHELRSTGLANIISGLGGGLAGFHSVGLSTLGQRSGLHGRMGGFLVAGLSILMLLFGTRPIAYLPRPVIGGVLLFLAFTSLHRWLGVTFRRLPIGDYLLIWLILIVIVTVSLLAGVAAGALIAVVLFAINYSQIAVVKHTLDGVTYRSNVDRSRAQETILQARGKEIFILKLQGMIFFGTAYKLLDIVRRRLKDTEQPKLRFLVLDFHAVTGFDSSAVISFQRLKQMAEQQDFVLVFSHISPDLRSQLTSSGYALATDAHLQLFPDQDRAVEWCEARILDQTESSSPQAAPSLWEQLASQMGEAAAQRLRSYCQRCEFKAGETLMQKDDPADALFFIESGRVTVVLPLAGGETVRLRSMGSGVVVGEMAMYLHTPRSASVIADSTVVAYKLTAGAMQRMEHEHPAAAAAFHQYMARLLAERLQKTDVTLQAMLD